MCVNQDTAHTSGHDEHAQEGTVHGVPHGHHAICKCGMAVYKIKAVLRPLIHGNNPSEYIIYQLGLVVTKAYSIHLCSAVQQMVVHTNPSKGRSVRAAAGATTNPSVNNSLDVATIGT